MTTTIDDQALTVLPPTDQLAVVRPPDVILSEAQKAARALKDVIDKKPKRVQFNGETYLEYEDWQTIGRFYGVTAKVTETRPIEIGEICGFEARAVALRADGLEISAADAMCMSDERNWKDKPLFQLRSMAQTRACAKALRNVLAWVVVLAGYKPTPAEEMDGVFKAAAVANGQPPIAEPRRASTGQAAGVNQDTADHVAEIRMLLEREFGDGAEQTMADLSAFTGTDGKERRIRTWGELERVKSAKWVAGILRKALEKCTDAMDPPDPPEIIGGEPGSNG